VEIAENAGRGLVPFSANSAREARGYDCPGHTELLAVPFSANSAREARDARAEIGHLTPPHAQDHPNRFSRGP